MFSELERTRLGVTFNCAVMSFNGFVRPHLMAARLIANGGLSVCAVSSFEF